MKNNLFMFKNVILCGAFLVTFGWIANSFVQAQCPVDNRLVKMPVSDDKYYLPANYIFKVKFDAPISTDTYKTGSIVQFSVIENVLGIRLPEFKDEAESKSFRAELDDIVNSYQLGIDIILEYYQLEIYEISDARQTEKEKADKLKTSSNDRATKLEELFAMEVKSIEYLFFKTAHPKNPPKIEKDSNLEILTIEKEFNSEISNIVLKIKENSNKEDFNSAIKKIRGNNLTPEAQFEKLKELVKAEKDRLEEFGEIKKNTLKKLKDAVEKEIADKISKVEEEFKKDFSMIEAEPDTNSFKKSKIKELETAKTKKLEELEAEKAGSLKKLKAMPEVVVVIPKTSKGFGKVEKAKRQAPLFLNYKARISVVLDYVLLDNGDCIPIEVTASADPRLRKDRDEIGNIIDCKSDGLSGKKCIKGRRPQYKFVSPVITGATAIAAAFLKNDTAQAVVGVTAAEQLNNGDLGTIINGADATISDKLIYEVLTTESRIGTIKKEEKK